MVRPNWKQRPPVGSNSAQKSNSMFSHSRRIGLIMALTIVASTACFGQAPATDALAKVQQRLASGEPTKIVCFGDSITGVYYHTGSKRAWCAMLGLMLQQAYPDANLQMINAGVSGHTTEHALARIERDVIAQKPDLVVIAFGMNDVTRFTTDEFETKLREIIERCQATGAAVVLCTPNAVLFTERRPEEKLIRFVETVRKVGANLHLPVADIFADWKASRSQDLFAWKLMMSDELHPNMNGHVRLAELIGSSVAGRTLTFDETPAPIETLQVTLDRLARGVLVKVVAPAPYDKIFPAQLKKLYPNAQFEIVSWPAEEQTITDAVNWAKQVRGLKPQLVIAPLPPQAFSASKEEFANQYEWMLKYCMPFGLGTKWDVVPVLPLDGDLSAAEQEYVDVAALIVPGKDLRFIQRNDGDERSPDEIVAAWIAEQKERYEN
ncbi:SGNH/GDSL hydrolase family protein [Blastopirellula marina]|uniref:SGNH hydrolase-type esterase domain-containing protein n=2 Tax=Blastopirellula marina TaxID=124 RepID=A0A2S8FDI1_9BACT|nr:hypothetical protein C5Y98_21675 [Blastopirellula marina]PTL42598.1 SGNH/GDSL hydrolase family protein [Blastopirellula marina]